MSEKTLDHSRRAHALLSASSAHRWLECPPSAVASEAYPRQDTRFTREGTLAHEAAETVTRAKLEGMSLNCDYDWREGITDEMVEHAHNYADYIEMLTEDDKAIILLEQRVDFSPWVPKGFGTADCIIIQRNTLDVIDYKYGRGVPVFAQDNPQEKLYGLGALNDYGFAYDIDTIRLHIYQPRIDNISVYELSADALLSWGEEIKPIAKMAAKGDGNYKVGGHCKFCPHAGRCRSLADVCTEYVQAHGLRVKLPILAPYEVAEALQMEPLITLWLKRLKEQALTSMLHGEQIPGWKVVEGKQGNRKWVDELQVAEALQAAGYSQEDYTERRLLSPAAMDKALGKKRTAELLKNFIERASGAPVIAPEADKRIPFDLRAELLKDFEVLGGYDYGN